MIENEETGSLGGEEVKDIDRNSGGSGSWNNKALKKTLTNKEIISQSIQFLMAGYETTSTTLEFIAYCLAMNQQCQDTLIDEIDRVLDQHVNIEDHSYLSCRH